MAEPLIAPRFLFRFSAPLYYRRPHRSDTRTDLSTKFRLPNLCPLDTQRPFADLRMAWNEDGLELALQISGKRQPVWCRPSRLEDSDGLQLWIDTRATHTLHRATRFCQRLAFLPGGGGRDQKDPLADQLLIRRARENAQPIRPSALVVRSQLRRDGYLLGAQIPNEALTGFDPEQHPQIGFTYAVYDRELGLQTFSVGTAIPYEEDPSTWATLELTGRK